MPTAESSGNRNLLTRIITSRGFAAFAVLMLGGWLVYTLISLTIGFDSDAVWTIGTVLSWLILPVSPVAYVIAGLFRPPAPFRSGVLMGLLATVAAIAYFAIDAAYWAYDWDWWGLSADGSVLGLLAVMVVTAGVVGLLGGAYTAITAWVTNMVRRPTGLAGVATHAAAPRPGTPSDPVGPPQPARGDFTPPPSSSALTLQQRLQQLDEARRAGLITEQEYVWRRTEIVSQA